MELGAKVRRHAERLRRGSPALGKEALRETLEREFVVTDVVSALRHHLRPAAWPFRAGPSGGDVLGPIFLFIMAALAVTFPLAMLYYLCLYPDEACVLAHIEK